MRINIILFNVVLLILLFVLIYLLININYNKNFEKFTGEGSVFLQGTNLSIPTANIVNTTYSTTQFSTDSIDMEQQETIQVDTLGNGPRNAFKSVVDIMCNNKMAVLKPHLELKIYRNGYYWIETSRGAKLTFIITNEEIFGGGWLLVLRSVLGSKCWSLLDNSYYGQWLTQGPTDNTTSAWLLGLPIRGETSGYNPSMGLNRYNDDYQSEFNISSIGNKIFNALSPRMSNGTADPTPNENTRFSRDSSRDFDSLFSIYRIYLFKEILCNFYYTMNEQNITRRTYIKIPFRNLDSISTFPRTLKRPEYTTIINRFKVNENSDLIYNFKINIYNQSEEIDNVDRTITNNNTNNTNTNTIPRIPKTTINCLLGCYGTLSNTSPPIRYLFAAGAAEQSNRNLIKSGGVLVLIPATITAADPIRYLPCGFEIFVK